MLVYILRSESEHATLSYEETGTICPTRDITVTDISRDDSSTPRLFLLKTFTNSTGTGTIMMSVPRRRLLKTLGTTGAMLVSAGCLANGESAPSGTSPGTDSRTPTPSSDGDRRVSMGQTVPIGDTRMTVKNPRVRKVVVTSGRAHTRVVAHEGQFVVVDVLIDGEPPDETAELALRSSVDSSPLPKSDPLSSLKGEPSSYAFLFPTKEHDTAAVLHTAEGARIYWNLPTTIRKSLAREPKFTIPNFQVQNRDGQLLLDMAVANEGDRDGTFNARVSLEGFSGGSIVEFPVPAGKSRIYTGRPGDILLYLENQGGGTLTVQYPADEGLTSIERIVQSPRTATESNT